MGGSAGIVVMGHPQGREVSVAWETVVFGGTARYQQAVPLDGRLLSVRYDHDDSNYTGTVTIALLDEYGADHFDDRLKFASANTQLYLSMDVQPALGFTRPNLVPKPPLLLITTAATATYGQLSIVFGEA